MKRIIIHWTAGTYSPNSVEIEHYHYLIGYEKLPSERGIIHTGKYKPEQNLCCTDGSPYAPHTGGGNTGSIGVAICGMLGYRDIKHIGNYPIKPVQMEKCYELCAELCRKYNIPIEKSTVLTHYEFGKKNPMTTSRGKVDIMYLASNPSLPSNKIGDFIRNKILWYFDTQEKELQKQKEEEQKKFEKEQRKKERELKKQKA